jgi:hypothetical protein
MGKKHILLEPVRGSYTPIPHAVLDSVAFKGCSHLAKALLFELLRQHNGRNNGHLQLAVSWLRKRGWHSNGSIQKGKNELLDRALIFKTRRGGLTVGPDLYALTWVIISEYRNLDVTRATYPQGQWAKWDPLPALRPLQYSSTAENGTVPLYGTDPAPIVPRHGTKPGQFADDAVPPPGNNECCQFTGSGGRRGRRVVGAKGRSGKKGRSAAKRATAALAKDAADPIPAPGTGTARREHQRKVELPAESERSAGHPRRLPPATAARSPPGSFSNVSQAFPVA